LLRFPDLYNLVEIKPNPVRMRTKPFLCGFAVLAMLAGCQKYNIPPDVDGDKIRTGKFTDVLFGVSGWSGGTIAVDQPGNALDSMEIIVPEGAYPSFLNFIISSAKITGHSAGEFFNPISPLIKISCDGGFAEKPIQVKIPVKVPAGTFAMGFLYNQETGELEGMPIDSVNPDFIIVSTRHFTTPVASGLKTTGESGQSGFATMVVSSVAESLLNQQSIVSSGFRPGTDDWEFINCGSYVAPGGQCAGQSISAMWYYYEKKRNGGPGLFHQLDEVCNPVNPGVLWQDNPLGYKFASVIQKDCSFGNWVASAQIKTYLGRTNWYAFETSMLVTGEPQLALIYQTAPNNAGHAIIVYKMNVTEGKLYVADPNFPNNRHPGGAESIRTIDFRDGRFVPYPGSERSDKDPVLFDVIGYFAKSSCINWSQISRRWAELEAGTIGNGIFPAWELFVNSTAGKPLVNDMIAEQKDIEIVCKSAGCEKYISFTDYLQPFDVFSVAGNTVGNASQANGGVARITLKTGKNRLGFHLRGRRTKDDDWIDFRWITINYSNMTIDPDPLDGVANQYYTFTAKLDGDPPGNAKYVWNFGDNTGEITKNNDPAMAHAFQYPGDYIVILKLIDLTDNKEIATAYSSVKIRGKYETLFIDPEHLYGVANKEYTFTARTNGDHPADFRMEWQFESGEAPVVRTNDSTAVHTFTKDGEYAISVSEYDNATNELVNYKSAPVTIASGLLANLKAAEWVGLLFSGDFKFSDTWWRSSFEFAQFLFLKPGEYSLIWTGNTFEFNYSKKGTGEYGEEITTYGNLKGDVAADGTAINSLTGYQIQHNKAETDSIVQRIGLSNLQYSHTLGKLIYFEVRGSAAANVVNFVEIRRNKFSGEPWNTWSKVFLTSVDYNSSNIPILTLEFWPK
jgi:hypothetical protein